MDKNIINLQNKPMSTSDLKKLTNNKCNIMTYNDLLNYKTLDDALGNNGAFIVLYETERNYGHWCACIKINNNLVEFFDPISTKPDKEFLHIPKEYKKNPYLSHLMKESPYKLSYNHYKFQKDKEGISTCGRWCALRVILKNMSLDDFKKLVTYKNYSTDYIVTLLTEMLL